MKDLVVFVDARQEGAGILEFAARLAKEHEAHLTGAFIADALPLLAKADAVEVLVVDHEGHSRSHGEEPGADIARHLARHGVRVDVKRMSSGGGDVGHLILTRAADFGADLVVMGAYGHSRLTELVFGGATRTALQEASLPVLMSR